MDGLAGLVKLMHDLEGELTPDSSPEFRQAVFKLVDAVYDEIGLLTGLGLHPLLAETQVAVLPLSQL